LNPGNKDPAPVARCAGARWPTQPDLGIAVPPTLMDWTTANDEVSTASVRAVDAFGTYNALPSRLSVALATGPCTAMDAVAVRFAAFTTYTSESIASGT